MPRRTVNGSQLYYELRGTEGDPAALIHGSWVDHHTWDLVAPGLARGLQVLSYDRRGHGESDGGPRAHPVRDDAADLAGLLESVDHFPVHVIAHSYGGAVAVRLAIDRPELVRSLSIHEPTFIGLLADDPATAPEWERLRDGVRELQAMVRGGRREAAAELFVDQFTPEPGAWGRLPESVRAACVRNADRWVEEFDDPDALAPDRSAAREIWMPALLTEGSNSPKFLDRTTRSLARLLGNSRVQVIPDAGHAPQLTRPDQFVGLELSFLLERNVPGT
jgi:pimeloyl-ACP methyl ester carboxylesterase